MSNDTMISVEGVSKLYRLGQVGTGTLSHDLNRWWHKMRGKEDPYKKIGQANDRSTKGESEYVWALKDINFEVKRGEVLGIIGRNGAGKSTLLKLLSKVTSPTDGVIKYNGRIASLLEVGTGFHPELTGRENIFLNGSILGMTKKEIQRKFDEIVDFSGVERYIDTPVKRYSSGMYVRLAFGVAAFLEPEILIVDEVLAVGDAEFQKKCLGRMKDVSNEGRTVLFVSHNMDSISMLCDKGLLLNKGEISYYGDIQSTVNEYLGAYENLKSEKIFELKEAPGNEMAKIISVKVISKNDSFFIDITDDVYVEVKYLDHNEDQKNTAIIHLKDIKGNIIFASNEFNNKDWSQYHQGEPGVITATCRIPGNFLAEGKYSILAAVGSYAPNRIHVLLDDIIGFSVVESMDKVTVKNNAASRWPGIVRPLLDWDIKKEKISAY